MSESSETNRSSETMQLLDNKDLSLYLTRQDKADKPEHEKSRQAIEEEPCARNSLIFYALQRNIAGALGSSVPKVGVYREESVGTCTGRKEEHRKRALTAASAFQATVGSKHIA